MHVAILECVLQVFDCSFCLSQAGTHQRQIVRRDVGLCFSLHQFLQLALRFPPFAGNRGQTTSRRRGVLAIAKGWGGGGATDGEGRGDGGSEGDRELRAVGVGFDVGVAVDLGGDEEEIGFAGE